jgi:hypothetical protein
LQKSQGDRDFGKHKRHERLSSPLLQPALHQRHAHPSEAGILSDHEAAAEGAVGRLILQRRLEVRALERPDLVPFARAVAIRAAPVAQHRVAGDDRLVGGTLQQRGIPVPGG